MNLANEEAGSPGRPRLAAMALASILMLMWPALINRQPFFFSDTTSYIRAGDAAARIVFGPGARTLWSLPAAPMASAARPATAAPVVARGNDPASGYIMAGRSPYFGFSLWLSWVTSSFWLFVLGQAITAYWLIGLMLRYFRLDRPAARLAVCGVLAVGTPLALYDGVLLADALSGFGVAAFVLLAMPDTRLARWERVALLLLLAASVISHLTHLVMVAGMAALIALLAVLGWWPRDAVRRPLIVAAAMVAVGGLSIMITSWVVKAYYGKPPVLVPLITARFIADGPGRAFIEAGCDGGRFAVCGIPYRGWDSSTNFLWSRVPATGAFLIADVETRRRMSLEDKAFAMAVARAYPLQTVQLAVTNTLAQLADLRVDVADERGFADPVNTGDQFPRPIVRAIAETPGGQGRWPVAAMNAVMYAAAFVSLASLAVLLPRVARRAPVEAKHVCLWLGLIGFAMLINSFLGGAISEPQSRYQTRMFWLVPMMAVIAAMLAFRRPRPGDGEPA